MSWQGHLTLDYRRDGERTIAHDRHDGPLRVLQRLYPEGDGICHHVLVHPPGGIAGGDELHLDATLQADTHAVITTPGATRFYRSAGDTATQSLHAKVGDGARLEWLPLETLAYRGCKAVNRMRFDLAPSAQMMGWDLLALGLPAAKEAYDDPAHPDAFFTQEIDLPGVWLERGTVRANDQRLLDSPLGWDGKRVSGTFWLATGAAMAHAQRQQLLDLAREEIARSTGVDTGVVAGATSAHDQVVVVRALAPRVEPLMQVLASIWATWRVAAWGIAPCPPRVWRT